MPSPVKAAQPTKLSPKEQEAAETLSQVKKSPPIKKQKGVVIKEGEVSKQPEQKIDPKDKGKGILVEEPKLSRKKQLSRDEELAKKLQEEELAQAQVDPQILKDEELARMLQEEEEEEAKKARKKSKPKQKKQSKAQAAAMAERGKMIAFLKYALGSDKVKNLYKMNQKALTELYNKEKKRLQESSERREKLERRIKAKHDSEVDKPFSDKEDSEEERKKRKRSDDDDDDEPISKLMGKRNKEPIPTEQAEGSQPNPNEATSKNISGEEVEQYMIVEARKVIDAKPIQTKLPEIVEWGTMMDNNKEFIMIKRADGSRQAFRGFHQIVRVCSRDDLVEMFKVGLNMYEEKINEGPQDTIRSCIEYLCMMFDPERVHDLLMRGNEDVITWTLYPSCGVHLVTLEGAVTQYYLVDRDYNFGTKMLRMMLKARLNVPGYSEMASDLLGRIFLKLSTREYESRKRSQVNAEERALVVAIKKTRQT